MDVRMDACGMNEFKEISLTLGQELRPVSDLHQISALHSDHSSLKPEGFVTAQLLILSHQKASVCQLQEGKKCYLHSRTLSLCKNNSCLHLPTSNLAFCLPGWRDSICCTHQACSYESHAGTFCFYFSCCSSARGLELTHGKRKQL